MVPPATVQKMVFGSTDNAISTRTTPKASGSFSSFCGEKEGPLTIPTPAL